jgi:septal ring factor EnvC (AmiA/AmiB activator)
MYNKALLTMQIAHFRGGSRTLDRTIERTAVSTSEHSSDFVTQLRRSFSMRRLTIILFATALAASVALAQNPPARPGMGSQMGQQQNRHEQAMKNMQADVDSMQANLKKMKEQLGKVSDQPTKDQLQLNIDMWQSLIDNMNKHLTVMKQMMGPGQGPMMRGHQPPPPKQQPSPQ